MSSPKAALDKDLLAFLLSMSYSAPFLQAPLAKFGAEAGPLHVDRAGPQYKFLEAHPAREPTAIRSRSRGVTPAAWGTS